MLARNKLKAVIDYVNEELSVAEKLWWMQDSEDMQLYYHGQVTAYEDIRRFIIDGLNVDYQGKES